MAIEEGYQGWANYETWAVALWISNEEHAYREWQRRAEEILSDQDGDAEKAKWELAEQLASSFEDGAAEFVPQQTVYADLMSAALGEVEWADVAADILGDRV